MSTCALALCAASATWSAAQGRLAELFYFRMLDHGVWLARRGMINLSLPIGDAECDRLVHAAEAFVESCNRILAD